ANNEEDGLNNSGGSSEISTSHASSEPHDHPGHFLSSNSAGPIEWNDAPTCCLQRNAGECLTNVNNESFPVKYVYFEE
ncbi:Hypothetical protein FKW44_002875, partial [Caligus rogercresseyi]